MTKPLHIIVTMAGFGRRFSEAGYAQPKYAIEIAGHSLFYWSMISLAAFVRLGTPFHFIMRAEDEAAGFVRREAEAMGLSVASIIELDRPTAGQAATVLCAGPAIANHSEAILIHNIDTHVRPGIIRPEDIRGDGWLPCFRAEGEHWSFADADEAGRVREVREKKRISPLCTIGLYYFDSFSAFERLYQTTYHDAGSFEAGEAYVAPLYNQLIAEGRDVYAEDLPLEAVHCMGTPEELASLEMRNLTAGLTAGLNAL